MTLKTTALRDAVVLAIALNVSAVLAQNPSGGGAMRPPAPWTPLPSPAAASPFPGLKPQARSRRWSAMNF